MSTQVFIGPLAGGGGGGGGAVDSVNGQTGVVVLTKSNIGLGNADNTSDANKPVSTATQTALNLKANINSPTFTGTVSGITQSMVGLGNVDNTSDANKPVSTAQAAADAAVQAFSIQRANHTGVQPDTTISTFNSVPANQIYAGPVSGSSTQSTFRTMSILDMPVSSMFFGNGTDGDATITSGTTTITRDTFYNNLTISGTGKLALNGCKIYVNGILDISAAPAGAIEFIKADAPAASGTAAGAQPATQTARTVGIGVRGVIGVVGGTTTGTSGTAAGNVTSSFMLQVGGQGGAGGLGASGAGGAAGAVGVVQNLVVLDRFNDTLLWGAAQISGAHCGSAGGGGGGDATAGGGSGAAGSGGGICWISARKINRSGSTAASAIRALGGNGGNGGTPAGGNRGGGGGGGGGAGGLICITYGQLTGSTATNCLDASGGAGGNGGTGIGTGVGGAGGGSGGGGTILLINLGTGVITRTSGPARVAGGAASGTVGGTGAAVNTFFANL